MTKRLEAFRVLDDERYRRSLRRGYLIGAMGWSGMTLGSLSAANLMCALLDWPRMPHWATLALTLGAALSLLLFHVNQRRLDAVEARFDEALRKALQPDGEA